jgi:mannitol/fructose-specific phosphotransferase system IIA component (Ntr-type)
MEALDLAALPLLQKGAITEGYIDAMKRQYPTMSPHILLRMNIAIPHSRPQDGVQSLGMSLLKINDGYSLENGGKVHIVVVIAAVDKNQHLNALLQLMKLADSNPELKSIIGHNDRADIYKIIQAFSN